jgi:ketosteroid isomerase-like protein
MKILICLASLFALLTLVFAQEKRTAPTSALQAMVDTERAFSKRSTDEGVRPAFLAFIADDGILFRPNAVNGKQWFGEHPAPPPSDTRPLLTWYPSVADISLAGDMGYTTGPWERRNDIHDADAVAWGNFLTVWKRQPDNSFKFVIDLGISNPQPEQVVTPWHASGIEPAPVQDSARNKDTGVTLTARELELSAASATRGAQTAFAEVAASDVRLFRNGRQPIVGKANAVAALNDVGKWTWEPAFADVARSGDLGYSYGSYELTKADPALKPEERVERGNYFRIWKRVAQAGQRTSWKIVTDLLDPVAPPKKN